MKDSSLDLSYTLDLSYLIDWTTTAGVDIRPESMDISWDDLGNALIKMKDYINKIGLWHSIAHDINIDENFVADLKLKIDNKYKNFIA